MSGCKHGVLSNSRLEFWKWKLRYHISYMIYMGGPHMIAIIFIMGPNMIAMKGIMGTEYDCNLHYKVDQIWLQWWSRKGLNKTAISIPKWIIYGCNPFQKGPNMIAMSKFVLESHDYDFWTNLVKTKFWSLQSYLILFERDCNHKWFVSELKLQLYLVHLKIIIAFILMPVSLVTRIAIIFGPHSDFVCNHIWFLTYKLLQS